MSGFKFPDITGSAIRTGTTGNQFLGDVSKGSMAVTGAIELVYGSQNDIANGSMSNNACGIKIDANKSNTMYGKSPTIQPKVFYTLTIIKA